MASDDSDDDDGECPLAHHGKCRFCIKGLVLDTVVPGKVRACATRDVRELSSGAMFRASPNHGYWGTRHVSRCRRQEVHAGACHEVDRVLEKKRRGSFSTSCIRYECRAFTAVPIGGADEDGSILSFILVAGTISKPKRAWQYLNGRNGHVSSFGMISHRCLVSCSYSRGEGTTAYGDRVSVYHGGI